jgi:PAS domain S-box-containing protein
MKQEDHSGVPANEQTILRWDKIIAAIDDHAILLLDRDGIILNWNKGAEIIKGYTAQEAVGQNFRIFYPPEDQQSYLPEKLIHQAIDTGKAVHEGWRRRKDGSHFWGSVVITALHNEQGNVLGFSKVTRDLTEKKFSEDLLKQKNEALERMNLELASFAYVASHDLQAPLRKIQTFAFQLESTEKKNFTERGLEFLTRIQANADRMQNLIQDLLTYAQMSAEERNIELVDLNVLLAIEKKDLEEIIAAKNACIESSGLPVLRGVRFQLHQLLANLLGNALKFSKPDTQPRIQVSATIVKGHEIKPIAGDSKKNYHHLVIADNGIGFDQEFNTKIFEIFQRLHTGAMYSGTGIGLAICKRIVENHGGMIAAQGEVNKGATFHIYIPAD